MARDGVAPEITVRDSIQDASLSTGGTPNQWTFGGDLNVRVGDLLILAGSHDLSFSVATPSGWSLGYQFSGFAATSAQWLFYKIADSTDATTTLTYSGSTLAYSNCSQMISMKNASFGSVATTSTTQSNDPPSISLSGTGKALTFLHYQDELTQPTITPPSGYGLVRSTYVDSRPAANLNAGVASALSPTVTGSENPSAFGGVTTTANLFYASSVALDLN